MGKNKTAAPKVEAPVVEEKKAEVSVTTPAKVMAPAAPQALSQHDKVLYTSVIQHRKDEMKERGGSATQYEALTAIEDAYIIDVAVTELVLKKNPGAYILSINEKAYEAIRLLGAEMGVGLPEYKSLPKPTKEQLAAVGLTDATGEGKVVLALEEKEVSKEAKKKKAEEIKVVEDAKDKDYVKDPTKIQNEEQLKEALAYRLLDPTIINPIEKLIATAQFYRAYLELIASNAEDSKAELEKVHKTTVFDLLQDITTMVPPTFITQGYGRFLSKLTLAVGNVIPAFNNVKRSSTNRKTGKCKFTDEEIAALVRVLHVWYVTSQIAEISKSIEVHKKNIETLKKDATANAKAIESENAKIDEDNAKIAYFQSTLSFVNNPDFEIVDTFEDAYSNSENALNKSAVKIYDSIKETYYPQVDALQENALVMNAKIHAGIILNLFSDPINKKDEYSESALTYVPADEVEEKPAEEESKNA